MYTVVRLVMGAVAAATFVHLAFLPHGDGASDAIVLAFAIVMIALTFGARTQRSS